MSHARKISLDSHPSIAQRYQNGESSDAISRSFDVYPQTIRKILVDSNIPRRAVDVCHRTYACDYSYFARIDTQEKAYWLGMLAADGYVSKTNVVGLDLKTDDLAHVYKLRRAIGSSHPVLHFINRGKGCRDTRMAGLRIVSIEMAENLRALGFTNKNKVEFRLPSLHESLLRHFIRGYFDGDGSVTGIYTAVPPRKPVCTITCHRDILTDLHAVLKRLAGIGGTFVVVKAQTNVCRLMISGRRQNQRFYDFLYPGATVWMPRKRSWLESVLLRAVTSPKVNRDVTPEAERAICEQYQKGYPSHFIAEQVSLHYSTILLVLRRNGIAIRGRNDRPLGCRRYQIPI